MRHALVAYALALFLGTSVLPVFAQGDDGGAVRVRVAVGSSSLPAVGSADGTNATVARLDTGGREALRQAVGPVVLAGFPLPGGRAVDLRLERFHVTTPDTRFVVGGEGGAVSRELDFDAQAVVLLRGRIAGEPDSHVFLAVSETLDQGYIDVKGGARYALTSRGIDGAHLPPGDIGVYVPVSGGGALPDVPSCGVTESPQINKGDGAPQPVQPPGDPAPTRGRRQLQAAIETDFEYLVLFGGDLQAAGDYVVTLYGAVSDIYMRDLNTQVVLTFVRLWDDPADLFNEAEPLGPFRDYWNDNMQAVTRDVAQFLSGRRNLSAGGVAYVNGLCTSNGYSWSGYTVGFFYDPAVNSPWNRDIMTTAHEIGHNCGTYHTHDYGLDTCQDENTPPARGTIMSYCGQTFTGGDMNMDMRFHAYTSLIVKHFIATRTCCLHDCNGNGVADALDIAQGTSQDADGNGKPDECEDCNGNGVPDGLDIASQASSDIDFNGVPDECDPDCNGNGQPDGADLKRRFSGVVFFDSFDTDQGWAVENLGATAGDWERGVPVDDPNTSADPPWASGGGGAAYLTGNYLGNSDVDGGATRLLSPRIDMSGGGLYVMYDYYLQAGDPNNDRLLVEGNDNDGQGTWRQLNVFTGSTGFTWRSITITPTAWNMAGLQQTANVRLRFTINDSGQAGTVEGGVDQVVVGVPVAPFSQDVNANERPDECEPDCDGDGAIDYGEITTNMGLDLNRNIILDSCEDCDGDGTPDLAALDHAHNIWLADNEQPHVREYLNVAGTNTAVSDPAGLDEPQDLIITPERRVLVTSGGDNRVVEFTVDGALVGDLVSPTGGLSFPTSMLVTARGTLLVASRETDSVLEFDLDSGAPLGAFVTTGAGGLNAPFGLAWGPGADGNLFVTSSEGQVLEFDRDTGAFVRVFVKLISNGGLTQPRGLLFLPSGNLLAASFGTDALLEYDGASGAFVRQFSQVGNGTVLTFDEPWCIRLGPDGGVYASRSRLESLAGGGGHGHDEHGHPMEGSDFTLNLHLTNARLYHFDAETGYFMRSYIMGVDSGTQHPTGFDFVPDAGTDCNNNTVPDNCDIASGVSIDINNDGVPDECQCVGDLSGDGAVGQDDLGILLAAYGCDDGVGQCPGDLNGDGTTGQADLGILLARYGATCE